MATSKRLAIVLLGCLLLNSCMPIIIPLAQSDFAYRGKEVRSRLAPEILGLEQKYPRCNLALIQMRFVINPALPQYEQFEQHCQSGKYDLSFEESVVQDIVGAGIAGSVIMGIVFWFFINGCCT